MLLARLTVCLCALGASLIAADSQPKEFSAAQRRWWAFQKVENPALPEVKQRVWVRNGIDAFILSKLESKNIAPNPAADKATLLRRASLDLTGLPPTAEEMQSFLSDSSASAWEKVIDRLLASPRYGERWGRHWLDVARYADSEGFKADETRPNVWRYRDYVIDSFNQDKPYDRFVREQIAGDELYPGDPAAVVATGFNRHFPDEYNARNLMQRRQELLNDITDTVGAAFLGMTYGCARCHDHKFDPILHKDYYRLQAFFAGTRIEDNLVLAPESEQAAWKRQYGEWEAQTKEIRDEMSRLAAPMVAELYSEIFDKYPEEIQDAVNTEPGNRTPFQWQMYYKAKPYLSPVEADAAKKLKGPDALRYSELRKQLAGFDSLKPAPQPIAQVMIDHNGQAPKTHVLAGGAYNAIQEEVQPGFLSIIDPGPARIVTGRRAALANWLGDKNNPLTARVMVNRIWHYHFGRGIVGTPSDFGVMGERPANRELLDHLSTRFVQDGWSMKKLHRYIMLSNSYQQSSGYNTASAQVDPDNKLQWRFNRRRLEGETLRDSMLAVSGLLNTKMGGPGVFPPLPPGVVTRGGWKTGEDPSESARRSVYVFVRRNTRYPMFEAFDMPDTHESCGRRNTTVSPAQALELLNSELAQEWSRALAARVLNDSGLTVETQVERAYRMAYARQPSGKEIAAGVEFLARHTPLLAASENPEQTALVDLCHMLLNSNEFVYLN